MLTPLSQRERLLDAMAQTTARHGYAGASVAEILKVARISRRTFYELFADKEDCLLAAYDEIAGLCAERAIAAYRAEHVWEAGVRRGYAALLEVLAAEPDYAHLAIVEILAAGPRGIQRRDASLRRFASFVEHTRAHLQTTVQAPPVVAEAIAGGIHELLYTQIVRGETAILPNLTEDLVHYTFLLLGIERDPA
jgi:AcrR family transcriptional regulator